MMRPAAAAPVVVIPAAVRVPEAPEDSREPGVSAAPWVFPAYKGRKGRRARRVREAPWVPPGRRAPEV
jgi:hypothetical protein